MISIHPTQYKNGDKFDRYSKGWCLPWHFDAKARGPFMTPIDCDLMTDITKLITEYVWSPCIWKNLTRKKENFLTTKLCVLDFDGTESLEYGLKTFNRFIHIIGTTRNHQIDKHGITCDRYRVVIPFEEQIDNIDQFEYNMRKLIRRFNSDRQPSDGARLYAPCKEIISIANTGSSMLVFPTPVHHGTSRYITVNIDPEKITYSIRMFSKYGAFEDGQRHDILYKVSADMTRQGRTIEEITSFIKPKTNLGDKEILAIVSSAFKRYRSAIEKV